MLIQDFYANPRDYILANPELVMLGTVTLIYIIIVVIIAIRIIIKFSQTKHLALLYAGLAIAGLASAWFTTSLQFVMSMLYNQMLPNEVSFLIHGAIINFGQFFWMMTITQLSHLERKTKNIIRLSTGIICIILEITYISIALMDWTLLGTVVAPIQADFSVISALYFGGHLISFFITGLWFSKESIVRAEDKRVNLKGKILLVSFILFFFGVCFEVFLHAISGFIVARITVLISAIFFYMGFLLPKWMERLFLKEM